MSRIYVFLISLLFPISLIAQVTTSPGIPTANQPVTITFNATQGDSGMEGYSGNDVYAYTGVLTNLSTSNTDWRYVVESSWLDNPSKCLMTRTGTNTYTLTMSPSIRAFYGVPDSEQILNMAFVFRNSTASVSGRGPGGADIHVPVYSTGLNVSFSAPSQYFSLVNNNQLIPVNVNATLDDSITLFLDNKRIKSTTKQALTDTVYASGTILHTLIAKAYGGGSSVADTVTYLVSGTTQYAKLPEGVHDGINYINDSTVTFVLFAPYKKSVYTIGDFNNWVPTNNYLMFEDTTKVPDPLRYDFVNDSAGVPVHDTTTMVNNNSRFWITVKGLTPGKEYIFQYLIDGSIRIADPYSEKISDPNYDSQIPEYIYPNLIAYPTGKTSGIAGVIQTAQTAYPWQVTNFVKPNPNNMVVYELLIRDFTSNKNIKTVTDTIAYLKRLGVNAIELMPFSQFDGNDSWGYNPSFYFAPAKAYGTRDDYKQFIDICHQNGIAVIQDMVLDFSTGNSPLVQMYYSNGNPTPQNPWYDVASPNTSYVYGNVFNHNSPYTRALTDSITSFWMNEYKIDGFRFDFVKGWTNTFGEGTPYDQSRINNLELVANHMWQQNPDAYVILELFTAGNEESLLANYGMMIWDDMNGNYEAASISNSNLGWDFSGISYQFDGWDKPNAVGYMESHDQERIMVFNETLGNSGGLYHIKDTTTALLRMELDNTLFIPVPGPKMIWMFGELGYDTSINYNGRTGDKPVLWNYYFDSRRKHLYYVVSALVNLKKNYSVFSTKNYSIDASNAVKSIELLGNDTTVEIVGNFDVYSNSYAINFPSAGQWFEYFTGDTITLTTSTSYPVNLNPGEYRLYSNRPLNRSYILAGVNQITQHPSGINVFPNPFNKELFIQSRENIVNVELTNIQGQIVSQYNGSVDLPILTDNLVPGVYIIKVQTESGNTFVQKLVKTN